MTLVLLALALVLGAAFRLHASSGARPMVFVAHAGKVPRNDERQLCHQVVFPRWHDTDVGRVVMQVKGGSHHVHLYRPYGGTVDYPPHNCPFAIDFSKWELVTATQNTLLDWKLPRGVAINFSARQPLLIQTHFVNTGPLHVHGNSGAKIKLYPVPASTVTAYGGAMFAQDRTVNVPPGRWTQSSTCMLTGTGPDARRLTIMALTGHYHFRGIEFRVNRVHVDGSIGELLYLHDGYSDPTFQKYPEDQPLVLEPGEGLQWTCTWQNDTGETLKFGPNTEMNEHCNLFGFYYPTQTPQEAIDCVHRLDDQGHDVNDRIVAQ